VVGVDTHRDTHVAELAAPTGAVLACIQIDNDTAGFTRLLEWIAEHAPGPKIVAAVEGTRSYGIGLSRGLTAAGLQVLECEQPARKDRRGRGKSDAIDAHLAVLFALRQDTTKLPTPRSDGPREALRILLAARQEIVTASTAQTNRLRALLLSGDDRDRDASRAAFTDVALSSLARRRLPADADRLQAVRHGEIRRLALAVREATKTLKANRRELHDWSSRSHPGSPSGRASVR
jgi:transposase